MAQSGAICPQGLIQQTRSGLTLCGRGSSAQGNCVATVFSTLGLNYSQVCGQVRGYQQGSTDGFYNYNYRSQSINGYFLDGVSISYGSTPRKHIWAYASGLYLGDNENWMCPCNSNGNKNHVPSFVGNNYYCETGNNVENQYSNDQFIYSDDPLWDGQQCVGTEAPCCTHPNMPWFIKTLGETTTEDVEVRVCGGEGTNNEDNPLNLIELFVY